MDELKYCRADVCMPNFVRSSHRTFKLNQADPRKWDLPAALCRGYSSLHMGNTEFEALKVCCHVLGSCGTLCGGGHSGLPVRNGEGLASLHVRSRLRGSITQSAEDCHSVRFIS